MAQFLLLHLFKKNIAKSKAIGFFFSVGSHDGVVILMYLMAFNLNRSGNHFICMLKKY
jgi:hypothetical protein